MPPSGYELEMLQKTHFQAKTLLEKDTVKDTDRKSSIKLRTVAQNPHSLPAGHH